MLSDDTALSIEKWRPKHHDYSLFDCGEQRLNNFLKLSAKKQQKNNMTNVYVIVEEGSQKILGYYTINAGVMDVSELTKKPKGTPNHNQIPILFIGQVAVDKSYQGKGIGSILMHHIFEKSWIVSKKIGCFAILLDVMSDGGKELFLKRKDWYEQFGFQTFASDEQRMFMTMKQVEYILR